MLVQNRLHRPLVLHHQTDMWHYPCMEVLLLSRTCMSYKFPLVFPTVGACCQWFHLFHRKYYICHPRRRSNTLGVGHAVRWDLWKQGNRRHGHRNHERLQIVVVHLAARHSRQKCYRLRHRDILTDLLDYHSSYTMVYPPKIRVYQEFTDALDPNWSIELIRQSLFFGERSWDPHDDLGPSDSFG